MNVRHLIVGGALAAGSLAGAAATPAAHAVTYTLPVCKDSNGSLPGGSVYLDYYARPYCDVVPPQRLHITRTPSGWACRYMGGHGWTTTYRICFDVDY
jgi:hypothetical protein